MPELVVRARDGEVLGEALFARMAALETDEARRAKLEAARLLEEQTLDTVERLAVDLGVTLDDGAEARVAGGRAGEALSALRWPDRMSAVATATGAYRELYESLANEPAAANHPAIEELLGHEAALNGFAHAEAAGDRDSLAILLAVLDDDRRQRVTG